MKRSIVPLVILSLTACAGGEADERGFEVSDSAGIRIATSGQPATERLPLLAPEASLDIGLQEGDEAYQLTSVVDATVLSDGSIAVADAGASMIRVYSADGRHLRSFGGAGDGPGEFRRIENLVRFGADTIGVYDTGRRRISVFSPEGSLVREVQLAQRATGLRAAPDGSFVAISGRGDLEPPARTGVIERSTVAVVRFDAHGSLADTVAMARGGGMQLIEVGPGPSSLGAVPYDGLSHMRLAGDTIVLGTAERCEIRKLATDGRVLELIRWDCDLGVTEEDASRWREYSLEMARREQPEVLPMVTLLVENTVFPETRAAYGSFLVSGDGSIWLSALRLLPTDVPPYWTILDAGGRLLGDLNVPDRFLPLEVGEDYVLGRWSDELDVQHVRLYELTAH